MLSRGAAAVLAGALLLLAVLCRRSCDTSAHLRPMLEDVADAFSGHNLTWALDSGSLLGAMRARALLAHEFDNDVSVLAGPALHAAWPAVRAELARKGYRVLANGDYFLLKGLLNLYFGSFDPYITNVDSRIYDSAGVRGGAAGGVS